MDQPISFRKNSSHKLRAVRVVLESEVDWSTRHVQSSHWRPNPYRNRFRQPLPACSPGCSERPTYRQFGHRRLARHLPSGALDFRSVAAPVLRPGNRAGSAADRPIAGGPSHSTQCDLALSRISLAAGDIYGQQRLLFLRAHRDCSSSSYRTCPSGQALADGHWHHNRDIRSSNCIDPESPLYDGRLHWRCHRPLRCVPCQLDFINVRKQNPASVRQKVRDRDATVPQGPGRSLWHTFRSATPPSRKICSMRQPKDIPTALGTAVNHFAVARAPE